MLGGLQVLCKGNTALQIQQASQNHANQVIEMEQSQAKSEQLQIIWQIELASSSVFRVMHSPVSHYLFLLKASARSHYNTLLSKGKKSIVKNKTVLSKFAPLGIFQYTVTYIIVSNTGYSFCSSHEIQGEKDIRLSLIFLD